MERKLVETLPSLGTSAQYIAPACRRKRIPSGQPDYTVVGHPRTHLELALHLGKLILKFLVWA